MNHAKEADDNLDFVTVQWSSGSPGLKVSCRLTFKNHTRNFISLLLWIIHLLRSDPVRSGPVRFGRRSPGVALPELLPGISCAPLPARVEIPGTIRGCFFIPF